MDRATSGTARADVTRSFGVTACDLENPWRSAVARRLNLDWLYVQPELVALPAGDHTDAGPVVIVGLQWPGSRATSPYVGLGRGPVEGSGDRGLAFLVVGASARGVSRRVVVRPEVRLGLLGESGYVDVGIAVGCRLKGRRVD